MATFINKAQVLGNITRDIELKSTQGDNSIAIFSVATNRYFKDRDGNQKEEVEFHNIVAWGKLAELCHKFLSKGARVLVEGRLKTRSWEGEDGKKNYRTEIVAQDVFFLDKSKNPESIEGEVKPDDSAAAPASTDKPTNLDDLPF